MPAIMSGANHRRTSSCHQGHRHKKHQEFEQPRRLMCDPHRGSSHRSIKTTIPNMQSRSRQDMRGSASIQNIAGQSGRFARSPIKIPFSTSAPSDDSAVSRVIQDSLPQRKGEALRRFPLNPGSVSFCQSASGTRVQSRMDALSFKICSRTKPPG